MANEPTILTEDEFTAIAARADAATAGPWEISVFDYDGEVESVTGACRWCHMGKPDSTYVGDGGVPFHRHHHPTDWHDIVSTATSEQEPITGNYAQDEGGIASTEADAQFIAHARADIPRLLATIEAMRVHMVALASLSFETLPDGRRRCPACQTVNWTGAHYGDCAVLAARATIAAMDTADG